jgi:thiol-disulfide isomerase/thioredoxin
MTATTRRGALRLLAGALALGACDRSSPARTGRAERLEVGELLPSAALADLDGAPLQLADLAGNPIVINFWASWCGPCRLEMPEFDRIWRSGDYPGLGLLAINVAEGSFVARQFADELGLQIPLALADRTVAGRLLGTASLPVTVFADSGQVVRHIRFGILNEAILRQQIEATLA